MTESKKILAPSSATRKPRAGTYFRVSTTEQSPESQMQQCRMWCEQNGYEAVEYIDTASGSTTSRKALDRMMADMRKGHIKAVVCYKMDRLGRSLPHLAQMIEEFNLHNCAFICPSQGIDTRSTNPAGRLQMHVLMAVAEFERALIRERTIEGIRKAKANGSTPGRRPGTGRAYPIAAYKASGMSLRAFCKEKGIPRASMHWAIKQESQSADMPPAA